MLRLLGQIVLWLRGESLRLIALATLLLLIWGTIAPVGTLIWWLNQGAENLGFKQHYSASVLQSLKKQKTSANLSQLAGAKPETFANCYIVFLPGVGDFSADGMSDGEKEFLERLVENHPQCVGVPDVFPYSTIDESIGSRQVLAPLWEFARNIDGWFGIADILIRVRNLWQFALSADDRYGQIYNQGIATIVIKRMDAWHSLPETKEPLQIVLIGTSGGAQVALGAVPYLHQWLNAQITVVSIGGVFNGRNGFDTAHHVYHLRGCKDWVEDIGGIVFPSRWLWTVGSPFNRSRLRGSYTSVRGDCQAHDGDRGYFGEAIANQDGKQNGKTYVDITLKEVNQLPIWSGKTQFLARTQPQTEN